MRTSARLFLGSVALLAMSGCGRSLTGPGTPTFAAAPITPDVVCVEQLTTNVILRGDNFSPVPVNDLTGFTFLALPTVDLLRSQTIDGMPAMSMPDIRFPGDPTPPMADAGVPTAMLNQLHWTSEQQMAFDITPGLINAMSGLGLYDVRVTDRSNAQTVAADHSGQTGTSIGALLAVPRPTLTSVVPDFFCDADHMVSVTINGDYFLRLSDGMQPTVTLRATGMAMAMGRNYPGTVTASSCRMLPGPSMTQACRVMTISVPMNDILGVLPGSEFDVSVTNPMNAHAATNCHTTDTVHLAVVPPPTIAAMGVSQTAFCQDRTMDTTVTIRGTGFVFYTDAMGHMQTPTVSVGTMMFPATRAPMATCVNVMGPLAAEMVQSCDAITFVLPAGMNPIGVVPLSVTNPAPADCHSATVDVQFVPRPTVTGALPTHLCAGGGTLGITGTGFVMSISAATLTDTAPPMTPDPATSNMVSDSMHMSSTWGSGLVVGDTYTLTVSNAPGCTGTDPTPITVIVGPQIFFADPPVLYSGISTQVTLYVTGIAGTVSSVTITPSAGGTTTMLTHTFDPTRPNRVQIIVPSGLAEGDYDIALSDGSSCAARLMRGLHVTAMPTISIVNVDPPFGWTNAATAVTVNGANPPPAMEVGFQPGVRLYLNPSMPMAGTLATPLESVTELSSSQLTAVVPRVPLPVGSYDLIAVNPDATVGVLMNAFRVSTNAPPTVTNVAPAVANNQAGQMGTVTGSNFDPLATVTLRCQQPGMVMITTITAAVTTPMPTSLHLTYDASAVAAGSVCVVRVTNPDMTYGDFSAVAITNPSANPQMPVAGPTLTTARRGAAGASASATGAARFVYAIGGDSGTVTGAMSSVEVMPVNIYGAPSSVFTQRYALGTARTYAGAAAIGRFIYVVGGDATSGPLATIERAYVLDPADRATITDLAIDVVMGAGVPRGLYYYRVAPIMPAADPRNPGGENLPSEAFPVIVPMLTAAGRALTVTLTWTLVPGATGYRVYRSPMAGAPAGREQLIQNIASGTTLTFADNGVAPICSGHADMATCQADVPNRCIWSATATACAAPPPLLLGSTGVFSVVGGAGLTTARVGPGLTAIPDPADATGRLFNLYAVGGRGAANLTSIEIVPVTSSGSLGASDTTQVLGAITTSSAVLSAGRWLGAVYGVTHDIASLVPAGSAFLYYTGGHTNAPDAAGTGTSVDEAFPVMAGGVLGARTAVPNINPARGGQGYFAGGNALYSFGGSMGGPSSVVDSAQITAPAPALSNWNNAGISLPANRVDMASAVLPGFGYLIGGYDGTAVTSTTFYVNW